MRCTATGSSIRGACIARGCPFVYAYEAWGHTFMGCLHKVFDVEIDVDVLE